MHLCLFELLHKICVKLLYQHFFTVYKTITILAVYFSNSPLFLSRVPDIMMNVEGNYRYDKTCLKLNLH